MPKYYKIHRGNSTDIAQPVADFSKIGLSVHTCNVFPYLFPLLRNPCSKDEAFIFNEICKCPKINIQIRK